MEPTSVRRLRAARLGVVSDRTGRAGRELAALAAAGSAGVQALGWAGARDAERVDTALAAGSTVVVLDAQRLDDVSLRRLAAAAQSGTRVLLVRATAEPPASELWADGGRALGADVVVAVDSLTPDEVVALAAARSIELTRSGAIRLHRRTAGEVHAVVAALDDAVRSGERPGDAVPAAEAQRVAAALAAIGASAATLARAVAVLGDAGMPDLAAVAGVPADTAALDLLTEHGLLIARRGRDGLRAAAPNPLTAQAVREATPWAELARLHLAAAEVTDPHRALRHRAAAAVGGNADLAAALAADGEALADRGEWSAAAAGFAAACAVEPAPDAARDLRIAAVDAFVSAGDLDAARELVPAIEALPASAERDAVLGYVAIQSGHPAEAADRLDRAWRAVNPRRDPLSAARIAHRRALDALVRWDGPALTGWADRAIELGGTSPPAVESRAFRGLGAAASGDVAEAARAVDTALAETGLPVAVSQRLLLGVGWIQHGLGDLDRARTALIAAREAAGGAHRVSLWALGWLARVQFETGDWDEALNSAREAVEIGDRTGIVLCAPLAHWTAAEVYALRGDPAAAAQHAAAARVPPTAYLSARIPAALAQVAATTEGPRRALAAMAPLLADPVARAVGPDFWPWHHVAARLLVEFGREGEARTLLDDAPEPVSAAAAVRLGAARALAAGDPTRTQLELRECLTAAEALGRPLLTGQVQLDLGMLLRRTGRRRDAAHHLAEADAVFRPLGAEALTRTTGRELGVSSSGAVGPNDAGAVAALTPHELNVARLVAGGDTNRRVAEQLYLSPKTVQFHLTRIFAKLGVKTRGELAARYGGELAE